MIIKIINTFFNLPQKVRFVIIGGCNSFLGLFMFWLFYNLFYDNLHYLAILFLSGIIAIFIAFVMMKFLVFRSQGSFFVEMFRSYITYLTILGLNSVILFLFVDVIGIPIIASQILATLILAVLSYIFHKKYSFRIQYEQ